MIQPTPKQLESLVAIANGYRYILTGGAVSTGKTYNLAIIFISLAIQYPKTRYAICRKNLSTIKRTTIQTFNKVADDMNAKQAFNDNQSDHYWTFANGSQIWFVELDESKDRDFNKLKGLELTAGAIDECNEVSENAYNILKSRIGRQNINGEPQFILMTCNPSDGWVKDLFYTPYVNNALAKPYIFIPSKPSDNPHNSAEYLKGLQDMPPAFVRRYVEGNWDYRDNKAKFFLKEPVVAPVKPEDGDNIYFGIDGSYEGEDDFVLSMVAINGKGVKVIEFVSLKEMFGNTKSNEWAMSAIIDYLHNKMLAMRCNKVAIDYGYGLHILEVWKQRHPQDLNKLELINFASVATPRLDALKPANKRAEMYLDMQNLVNNDLLFIDNAEYAKIREEYNGIPQPEYENNKLLMPKKTELKKLLGRSPDNLDALALAIQASLIKTKGESLTTYDIY